jgi:serine/threonine protein phosphatase 1
MPLPTQVTYPIAAIGDVHGQRAFLQRLLAKLRQLPEWPELAVVFLGDFVDRGPDVKGTLDLLLDLMREHPNCSAVLGNHDLALVSAARLEGQPRSAYWLERYLEHYDHEPTFRSYLGRDPDHSAWEQDLDRLRESIPARHREFLTSLPWVVEAPGHLFLHCGLSPEVVLSPPEQVRALHARRWERSFAQAGTRTEQYWQGEYPVWIGADRFLSDRPQPYPGKVQVSGHVPVDSPEANAVRIRLDTSGGFREPLTACLLRSATAEPEFIPSS